MKSNPETHADLKSNMTSENPKVVAIIDISTKMQGTDFMNTPFYHLKETKPNMPIFKT